MTTDIVILAACRHELHSVLNYTAETSFVGKTDMTSRYTTKVGRKNIVIIPLSYHEDVAFNKVKKLIPQLKPKGIIACCAGSGVGEFGQLGDVVTAHGVIEAMGPAQYPRLKSWTRDGYPIFLWDKPPEKGHVSNAKKVDGRAFAWNAAGFSRALLEVGHTEISVCVGISSVAGKGVPPRHSYYHALACGRAAQAVARLIDPDWEPKKVKCELCGHTNDPFEPTQ